MFEKFKRYLDWKKRTETLHEAIGYVYNEPELLDMHLIMNLTSAIKRFNEKMFGYEHEVIIRKKKNGWKRGG